MATTAPEDLDTEHAAGLFRLALPLMSRHEIPLTPQNYAVWFRYASGTDPALRECMDEHLARDEAFTPEFNELLYQRFVLYTNEQMLEEVRRSMRALLSTVSAGIDQADDGLKGFVERLGTHCERLRTGLSQTEVEELAQALLGDTRTARENSERLHRTMREGRHEVEDLRAQLDRAISDAGTDALTGVGNRRALQRAAHDLAELTGAAGTFSVLFADIDHFKRINDNFGHLVGDKVLRYVADVLRRSVKGHDTVTRYGGEEFVLLLPETSYDGAMQLAESVRRSIESGRLVRADTRERIGAVTVSLGVAEWRAGEELDEVLARADVALQTAKNSGRNRVLGERNALVIAV